MKTLTRYLLCLIILASCVYGDPQERSVGEVPSFLIGKVGEERILLYILPEKSAPLKRKLKGTRFINVEPGCIMVEAYVKLVGDKKIEIRMPHDDWFTSRTMKKMGITSKNFVVTFEPAKVASHAGAIEAITPLKIKPSEQKEAD